MNKKMLNFTQVVLWPFVKKCQLSECENIIFPKTKITELFIIIVFCSLNFDKAYCHSRNLLLSSKSFKIYSNHNNYGYIVIDKKVHRWLG